jgi:hypothetical protein
MSSMHPLAHAQAAGTLPLASNVANVVQPGPPQPQPYPQFIYPPHFGPGPF